ncbi:MAG: hypothetical protein ACOYO0_08835, partial [Sandarakinorhabdus sp.]
MWQILALFWMIFFGAILFIGYYLLIQESNILGFLAGLFMASLAIIFSKVVGSSSKSFSNPLFYFLLIISAFGVASAAFLNFEGPVIVADTVSASQQALRSVETQAAIRYDALGIRDKLASLNG